MQDAPPRSAPLVVGASRDPAGGGGVVDDGVCARHGRGERGGRSRGGAQGATDLTLFSQLARHPAALGTVAALMVLFALVLWIQPVMLTTSPNIRHISSTMIFFIIMSAL